MFELNKILEQRALEGNPIHIALIGTGTMGKSFAASIGMAVGMELDVVCDLRIEEAIKAFEESGVNPSLVEVCNTLEEAERALKSGKKVVTSDYHIACEVERIECVYESTGVPDVYALVGICAITNKKHYITMNVEGDVAVGHLMNMWAKSAGVVYTGIYGDEPGSAMLSYYEAKVLGFEILAVGRSDMGGSKLTWNKDSIVPEMKKYNVNYENSAIYASFCDGSKTNEECCMIANACGLRPDVRGMHGPYVGWEDFVQKVPTLLKPKSEGGILTHTGVVEKISVPGDHISAVGPDFIWEFTVVRVKTQGQKDFMLHDKGIWEGDIGLFYAPYHYGSVQAPISIAYASVYNRATIAPLEGKGRCADVVTMAKQDLKAGTVIDEIGGYHTTGRIECASITRNERLLPFALARGATLKKDIPQCGFLTYDDVEFPEKMNMIRQLRMLQDRLFGDKF